MNYSTPGFPVLHYLPDFARTHVHWFSEVMPCNPGMAFILCHPLHLLPSIFPSIRVFSNESALRIRWPKYWSFSISPSNEYSGLISFRIDWFDVLSVQGTLRSPLQHHSLKAWILWRSDFFTVQLSYISVCEGRHARGVLTSLVIWRSLHVFLPLSCCLGDKLFFTCPHSPAPTPSELISLGNTGLGDRWLSPWL